MVGIASSRRGDVFETIARAAGGRARGGGLAPRDTLPGDAVRLPTYKRLTGGAEAMP